MPTRSQYMVKSRMVENKSQTHIPQERMTRASKEPKNNQSVCTSNKIKSIQLCERVPIL